MNECADRGGTVFITGVGKSGLIGARLAASLRSIAVPSTFVYSTEFLHGDLGAVRNGDLVVALSHSGGTAEVCALLPHFLDESAGRRGIKVAAIVGKENSKMEDMAHETVVVPGLREILGKVPSASVVAQVSVSNAILAELIRQRGVSLSDFKRDHPGGSIGGKGVTK
jgi:arabinose-5-phosphate isomerase